MPLWPLCECGIIHKNGFYLSATRSFLDCGGRDDAPNFTQRDQAVCNWALHSDWIRWRSSACLASLSGTKSRTSRLLSRMMM